MCVQTPCSASYRASGCSIITADFRVTLELNFESLKMAMMASPASERVRDTRKRFDSCWQLDLAWDTYPQLLSEVSN